MTARVARGATLLALAALVIVLGFGFRRDPHDIKSAIVGRELPPIELVSLDGSGRIALHELRGKVVVVNFFASWCVPCKEEHPALVRAWERFRAADVVFVGIVYQDSLDAARAFAQRLGTTWPTAADEDGRAELSFGVLGVPETFFIGADGVVEGRHKGPIDEVTLVNAIETLRAKARTP